MEPIKQNFYFLGPFNWNSLKENLFATLNIHYFVLTLLFAFLSYIANKDFYLSDEGLFFSYGSPREDNLHAFLNYNLFFKILRLQFSVVHLRLLRFFILILIGFIFYFLWFKKQFSLSNGAFLMITLFAGYGIMPQSLSYYTLTLILMVFITWCLKSIIYGAYFGKILLLSLVGLFCSLLFFIRPPSSLLVLLIAFLIIFFLIILESKNIIIGLGFGFLILFGFLIPQLLLNCLFPEYSFLGVLKASSELNLTNPYYDRWQIIKQELAIFKWTSILLLSGILSSLTFSNFRSFKLIHRLGLFLGGMFFLIYFFLSHSEANRFGLIEYSIVVISIWFIGFLIGKINFRSLGLKDGIFYILLFAMPFIGTFGSNVYFFRLGVHYIFFWWLLILVLVQKSEISLSSISTTIYSLTSLLIFSNVVIYHYPRISDGFKPAPLVSFRYGNNNELFLREPVADYFSELVIKFKSNYNDLNQGYVLGMYQMPGEILLGGMKIYFNPLIWSRENLYLIKNHAKYHPKYKDIFPLIISRKKSETAADLEGIFRIDLIDSLNAIDGGKIYFFQSRP